MNPDFFFFLPELVTFLGLRPISSSCFLVSVLLAGGIVGVAGQFRGWQFAAYAVYPFCFIDQTIRFL